MQSSLLVLQQLKALENLISNFDLRSIKIFWVNYLYLKRISYTARIKVFRCNIILMENVFYLPSLSLWIWVNPNCALNNAVKKCIKLYMKFILYQMHKIRLLQILGFYSIGNSNLHRMKNENLLCTRIYRQGAIVALLWKWKFLRTWILQRNILIVIGLFSLWWVL